MVLNILNFFAGNFFDHATVLFQCILNVPNIFIYEGMWPRGNYREEN